LLTSSVEERKKQEEGSFGLCFLFCCAEEDKDISGKNLERRGFELKDMAAQGQDQESDDKGIILLLCLI